MLSTREQELIKATKDWIEKVVLGLNLCPFAHLPFQKDLIRFRVIPVELDIYRSVMQELNHLQDTSKDQLETTVLILGEEINFQAYLNLVDNLNVLLEDLDLEGVIQIATFHPDYQFEGTNEDDITNCTNRSPYPLIHLLRESSVSEAIDNLSDVHAIPILNQEKLIEMGWSAYRKLLQTNLR